MVKLIEKQVTLFYSGKNFFMKKMKRFFAVMTVTMMVIKSDAQDPSFSQFFASPLNVNPALTAHINADWRAISNFRDQWLGPASPYATATASYDAKLFNKHYAGQEEGNVAGGGLMFMYDRAMGGVVKSSYASADFSYRVKLTKGPVIHRIGAGFGTIYGHRRINFSGVDFEEQFTGYGFNTNLPHGESSLSQMKPYFSVSTGLLYSITAERWNVDLGGAMFHVNRPKQTFLKDERQYIPIRYVAHANFEAYISDNAVVNINTIYQHQLKAQYYSFGAALGYFLPSNPDMMLSAGAWYWSKNAVIPYFGFAYKDFQLGLSYDATISKLNDAANKPNTYELSLILRGRNKPSYVIPCPWK
jgi:type IX secretion system PorP/SprF family membrane protein